MFAGNVPPAGWMFCEGALLPISENETLFQLIGTTYGGDGQSTFALPDLRGRVPLHQGNGFILAETGGAEEITLTVNQIPSHTHTLMASLNVTSSATPTNTVIGKSGSIDAFINAQPTDPLNALSVTSIGNNQPHTNMQPYLCIDFIISLFGIFPSPT
jgi:microcystin-dependent protein